ncbi:MAG: serine hydrolase domain-containing protein [Sphingomonas sp.]
MARISGAIAAVAFVFTPFLAICPAAALTPAAATDVRQTPADSRFDAIRAELRQLTEAGTVQSVSIGVLADGRVVWAESFGWADREARRAPTVDTPYAIASLGKAVTATAALTLVQNGRLALDRPVTDVLGADAVRLSAGGQAPTLRQLLNMTGGVPHGAVTYRTSERPTDQAIETSRFITVFPPGEVFHYSNFSIALVDAEIERASGAGFGDYLRDAVFAPLAMTHSVVGASGAAAVRYLENGERMGEIAPFPRSSRQIHSSLTDLLRFGAFHLGTPLRGQQAILSDDLRLAQQTERSGLPGAHMALGWASLDIGEGRRWVIGSGNDMGAQATLILLPHANVAVAVLINSSGYQSDELAIRTADAVAPGFAARAMAAAQAFEAHSRPFTTSPEWTGRWSGTIQTPSGPTPLTLEIRSDNSLQASIDGQPPRAIEGATLREGLLTGATTGRLALEETPPDEHRIEFGLRRADDRLTGFVLANFPSARGKFEMPAFVSLRRIGATGP